MTLNEAEESVSKIKRMRADDEAAHSREDALYLAFVEWIAKTGNAEQASVAREILKTQQIEFARWCA